MAAVFTLVGVEAVSLSLSLLRTIVLDRVFVKNYGSIYGKMARNKNLTSKPVSVLQRLREEAGLTQAQLAKLIPDKTGMKTLSQRSVSKWETGQSQPELTIFQTKALCRALGKSLDELPDNLGFPRDGGD
jgi:DNA-binding XRE family transcriptional regulator